MLLGIIHPWLKGSAAAYKPTGWIKENRPGFIDVDSNRALVIEGMGTSRKTLREIATYSIWVDTEPHIARERVVQRDLANGENGGTIESITKKMAGAKVKFFRKGVWGNVIKLSFRQ